MKHIIAIILVALCSVNVMADNNGLYLGGWSKHLIANGDKSEWNFNESHEIVAIEYNNWIGGYFKNSYGDDSGILMRKYHIISKGNWEFDVGIGATYGYKTCKPQGRYPKSAEKMYCPAVVPELTYTKYRVQPSFMVMSGAVSVIIKVGF